MTHRELGQLSCFFIIQDVWPSQSGCSSLWKLYETADRAFLDEDWWKRWRWWWTYLWSYDWPHKAIKIHWRNRGKKKNKIAFFFLCSKGLIVKKKLTVRLKVSPQPPAPSTTRKTSLVNLPLKLSNFCYFEEKATSDKTMKEFTERSQSLFF